MEKSSFLPKVCDFITKYAIFALIFLMPLFFLPWTSDVLDFNKRALMLALVAFAMFAWMLKSLLSGKIEINAFGAKNISVSHVAVGVLFLMGFFSTAFSVYPHGSFWGWPQNTSESLLTLICLAIFYFITASVFSKKDSANSVYIFSVSAILAQLFAVLQLAGIFILPLGFTKTASFNTVGSAGSLGMFAAALLPLAIIMLISSKKWWRALFGFQLALSMAIFLMVDYPIVWWAALAASVVTMALVMQRRNFFDVRWTAVIMFFLAVSLFFTLINPRIGWIAHNSNEIFLSQQASAKIALQAVKERPIFGSGMGTYYYDFSKFKDSSFYQSSIWNTVFNRGGSKILNDLATTGIFGLMALLAFIGMPVFYGLKFLIAQKDKAHIHSLAVMTGLCATMLVLAFSYFLFNSSLTLDFVYFFVLAGLANIASHERKEYEMRPSSMFTLAVTFAFTLVFIFGFGLLILDAQRYAAEASYLRGLSALQSEKMEDGIAKMEFAANSNPESDLYFRQLSQVYLAAIKKELQKPSLDSKDEEAKKVQILLSNAIDASKIAADINRNRLDNWSVKGFVHQSLLGILPDAQVSAINSYDEALKLSPDNPYILFQQGNIYFTIAEKMDSADKKPDNLAKAQEKFEAAVKSNPYYSNALYALGLVYDEQGSKIKAIEQFTKVQQLNPGNEEIIKILANLKAGRSALQVATPPAETPTDSAEPIK